MGGRCASLNNVWVDIKKTLACAVTVTVGGMYSSDSAWGPYSRHHGFRALPTLYRAMVTASQVGRVQGMVLMQCVGHNGSTLMGC